MIFFREIYDLMFSIDLPALAYGYRHFLSMNRKNNSITIKYLETIAMNNNIQNCRVLVEKVIDTDAHCKKHAKELDIYGRVIGLIPKDFIHY